MPAAQHTLRTELFPTHHPLYGAARKRAFAEIEGFAAAAIEARLASEGIGLQWCDELFEQALEPWHEAAEVAEWLLENPNATAILKEQGRLGEAEEWAAMRPTIGQWAIDLHRSGGDGEGA